MITQQQRKELTLAAVDCEHQINADCIRLWRDPTKEGTALAQLMDRIEAKVRQYIEQSAPGDDWVAIPEGGMPPLGEQVLVWCKYGPHWGPMVDCWDEQHEAPVSFSSATIPVGPGWDSGAEFEHVTHWKRIAVPVAAQQSQEPKAEDAELLDWLEAMTDKGYCPAVVFDDDGHWAVLFDGIQSTPGDGPLTSSFITGTETAWHDSIRAAIHAAIKAQGGKQ